ncbi:MAG: hypothetical protein ABEJ83_03720 [Candidatus Nanohaloarchaea archaeon]
MIFRIIEREYNRFYPKMKDVRGATRLKDVFSTLAEKEALRFADKVNEGDAESIFSKESWQNLVILDACRYDIYEEMYGNTEFRISLGNKSV